MIKYWQIFKISFEEEFVYRLNFILWRVRNVIQIFIIFFLWDTVFSSPGRVLFGYDRAKILTYILGLIIVRAVVTASRTIDISGEISRGELANYLLKPISYFKFWFTRDLSSKALNLVFAVFEISFLFLLFKPPFYFQTNPVFLILFLLSLSLSVVLYFLVLFIFNLFTLWYPEQAWGVNFLLYIFVDFLGGGIFPLDILPEIFQKILYATPFPYLIFTPLQVYLGRFDIVMSLKVISLQAVWVFVGILVLNKIWEVGLRVYSSEGR